MKIDFAGQEMILHPEGLILWPSEKAVLVSDLHLEKGSHFARKGYFLPPYDSQDTLQRLIKICREGKVEKLLILGDCFHDNDGYKRLGEQARELFEQLSTFNPIWIKGNHDREFVPEHFPVYDDYTHAGITFRHEALPGALNEISGHFHPKVMLGRKPHFMQHDCFVTDGTKLILPAFGSYTGGLSIDDKVISSLFVKKPDVYALGESRVYRV